MGLPGKDNKGEFSFKIIANDGYSEAEKLVSLRVVNNSPKIIN